MLQELILTRGIPASGKTTWAKQYILEGSNRIRVNRDDIREEQWLRDKYKGRLKGKPYYSIKPFKEYEEEVTRVQHMRIHEAFKAGKTVVVDDTNLMMSRCKPLIRIANQYGIPATNKDFPVALAEAKRRNQLRDRVVPEHVLENMFSRLGPNGELSYWDGSYDANVKSIILPNERRHAVGFDMDGTLSDTRPIQHFVQGKYRDFDSFHRLSEFTQPNPEVLQAAYDAHKAGLAVVITTARNEYYRAVTQKWLDKYEVPYENIFMRQDGDMRPDYVVKKEMYDTYLEPYYDMVRMHDDNPQAVGAWKEKGIAVTEVPGFGDPNIQAGWEANRNAPVLGIDSLFATPGRCLRCGRPVNNGELFGPTCKQIR